MKIRMILGCAFTALVFMMPAAAAAQTGIPEGATGQSPAPPAVGTAQSQTVKLPLCTGETNSDGTCKAPAPTAPPALTVEQKQQITIALQQVTIWELQAQRAAAEVEKARAAAQQLVSAIVPPGYSINEKLELVKLPEPKKEPGKQ